MGYIGFARSPWLRNRGKSSNEQHNFVREDRAEYPARHSQEVVWRRQDSDCSGGVWGESDRGRALRAGRDQRESLPALDQGVITQYFACKLVESSQAF